MSNAFELLKSKGYSTELINRQLTLENESHLIGNEQYLKDLTMSIERGNTLNNTTRLLVDIIYPKLLGSLEKFIDSNSNSKEAGRKPISYILLKEYNLELVASIAIQTIFKSFIIITKKRQYMPFGSLAMNIGQNIIEEHELTEFIKTDRQIAKTLSKNIKTRVSQHHKRMYAKKLKQFITGSVLTKPDKTTSLHIGTKLIELLTEDNPLLLVDTIREGEKTTRVVRLSDMVSKHLEKRMDVLGGLSLFRQPCIVEPKDWEGLVGGGYYTYSKDSKLIRRSTVKSLQDYTIDNLRTTLQAVNTLQKTPWKVNSKVLETLEYIMQLDYANIKGIVPVKGEPAPSKSLMSASELKNWSRIASRYYKNENKRIRQRLKMEQVVKQAQKFKDDVIYFPHAVDFRDRIYALPFFNPQGSDLMKGLLTFAEEVEVDEGSLQWVKIQAANKYGIDKVDYSIRLQWFEDNKEMIMSIGENPIDNLEYLEQAKEPFCFLAACIECYEILSGIKNTSSLPISFDGTCSGVQHYTCLLKNDSSAFDVNLTNSEHMQDLYSAVTREVKKQLEYLSKHGSEDKIKELIDNKTGEIRYLNELGDKSKALSWLSIGLDRSVSKACVMGAVYSSREYGFKEFILKYLNDLDSSKLKEEHLVTYALFLADIMMRSIKKILSKIMLAMDWLGSIAVLANQQSKLLSWELPDGFKVVTRLPAQKSVRVASVFHNDIIRTHLNMDADGINKRKHKNAIAANVVQSLDAYHLRTLINYIVKTYGVTILGVIHDAFQVRCTDAAALYQSLRKTLVDIYSKDDILASLIKQFEEQLGVELPEPPTKGSFDLNEILNATYAFS